MCVRDRASQGPRGSSGVDGQNGVGKGERDSSDENPPSSFASDPRDGALPPSESVPPTPPPFTPCSPGGLRVAGVTAHVRSPVRAPLPHMALIPPNASLTRPHAEVGASNQHCQPWVNLWNQWIQTPGSIPTARDPPVSIMLHQCFLLVGYVSITGQLGQAGEWWNQRRMVLGSHRAPWGLKCHGRVHLRGRKRRSQS